MIDFLSKVWSLVFGLTSVIFVALMATILVLTVVVGIKVIRKEWRK